MASNLNPIKNPFIQQPFATSVPQPQYQHDQPANDGENPQYYQQNPYSKQPAYQTYPYMPRDPKEQKFTNSNKYFVRTSAAVFPSTSNLIQKANIPVGAVFSPLSPLGGEVPLVSTQKSMIIRCDKCRTYINPYVKIGGGGEWWICNLCGSTNNTPAEYVELLSRQLTGVGVGQHDDFSIALQNGSVEFIASSDYMVRSPQPPIYLFIIDVSSPSVQSGFLELVCNVIKNVLKEKFTQGVNHNRTIVGIITYDSTVHFYNLNPSNKGPKMYIVPDLEDMFIPLAHDILVNLAESYNVIENLLETLPNSFKDSKISGNCMGSAITAAHLLLYRIGGLIVAFTSLPPTLGDYFSKASYKGLQTSSLTSTFTDVSTNLVRSNISVELFVGTLQPLDMASLEILSTQTSGDLHYYPLKSHHYNEQLRNDLYNVLTRETGWEAVMRVRISRGWKIKHWFGHFHLRGSDLMVLPVCHSNQTFSLNFELKDNLAQEPLVYFQSALLYTTSNGERRIRVNNYALPVSDNYNDIVSTMDPEVCIALLCNEAIQISKNATLPDGRDFIQSSCSKICEQQVSGLSENIKLLIIYCLGLLKSVALRETKDVSPELRTYHFSRLKTLPPDMIAVYCYPSLYPLHNIENVDNATNLLPEKLALTNESLSQEGAYLLEDGESIYLWIGRCINPQWLYSIFGTNTIDNLHPESAVSYIESAGTTLSVKLDNIIKTIRSYRLGYMPLIIIRQGDPLEYKFYASLIEDKSQALMVTLNEFISKMAPKTPLDYQTTPSYAPVQGVSAPASYAQQGFQPQPPQPPQHASIPAGYGVTKKFNPPGPPPKL